MQSVSDWQNPFVDIFKRYDTFQAPKSYKGSVNIVHDPIIARKTFKLSGSILSNNTITIPDPNSEKKTANLIGRYIYLEFMASPQKYFCVHFEIGIKDREPGVRFSFTNMEKQYCVTGGNTLKIPFVGNQRNLWTIACIDIEHHLENFGLFSKGVIKNYTGVHVLKGIQLCSNITVRGVYTSNNVYDWESLPKEMSFKMVKGGRWQDSYNFAYLPNSINPAQIKKKLKEEEGSSHKEFPNTIVQREEASTTRKKKIDNVSLTSEQIKLPSYGALPSQPFIQLSTAFSFSSLYNPDMIFKNDKIYYSAGGILVCKDINTGEQKFMQGHTDYIVAMDYHQDWIVTVQEGAKSSVRIWIDHKCICSFQCPYEKVQQIRISHKKHLAMVGLDPYKRQAILIFDISQIQTTRKPVLIAKQISDFNILTIKFSPVDTQKLVSCGKQNIRFWRTKNQHLPGSPVILNQHARNTIFTVFDFEYHFDDPNPLKQRSQIKRVYVGTQTGLLFQINYNTHELEQVYKLHDNSAISSVCIGPKFCVTGGQDQLLRVWQMDFSQFTLEAANDGVVTSLVLSEDATQVACGTSTGTLSILELTTNNCKTIIRSHTQPVTQIVFHQFSNSMITLSNDLTIRLWDVDKLEQTYEFSYPANDACLCLNGCPNGMYFAAGFKSGVLRIFDIEKISVIEQIKHHQNPILHVEYSPDGRFLAVLEDKLNMLYSPMHSHQPIKHLPVQIPSKYKHSSFSDDSQFIALIGDSGTHINIWALKTLQMIGKIFTGKIIKKLKYHENTIWVIFEDTSIRRYNLQKMTIQVQMQALHRQSLNDIDFDVENHLLFSVGDDSFVKVWDYSFLREPHQVFIGHANKINGVVFKNNRLWTIGSQGVLVWDFKSGQQKFIPPPIFAKQKKASFINNPHTIQNTSIQNQSNINLSKNPQRIQQINQLDQIEERAPQRIKFSNVMKKNGQSQIFNKFVPQKIDMKFQQKTISFRKNKKRQGKPQLVSQLPAQNKKNLLPLRHYYQQNLKDTQLQYPKKIQMIKQNNKKYKLQYIVGLQPSTHDHVVWNFMYGWYAYIFDNLIIVQSLNKNRSQRVITLPQKLASLTLSKDFKKLLCSSAFNATKKQRPDLSTSDAGSQISGQSAGQNQQSNTANIYVLGQDFTIQKKLQFHPRGVQSFKLNQNNKFLVSIGNFRQCTVCVWDYQFGKLKASNYTLDKLNDIAIMKGTQQGRLLQFATVGRDQIHFWIFTKDQKLQYYDLFIKSEDQEQGEVVELTSCDYLEYEDAQYLLCGTTKGELVIVRYGDFKIVWRKNVCSSQIMNIKCLKNRTVLGCADGNVYFWNHDTNILQSEPNPSFLRMNLYYSVNGLYLDQQGTQGIVSTAQAIYYVNLQEQYHSLLAGSSPRPVIMTKSLNNNQFMLTSHQSGRLKLWNVDTAQELKTYKWKYPCTQAYYDDSISKVVCFCQNQSVKLVNIKKFTKQQNYLPEQLGKIDNKTDDFIIYSSQVMFGNRPSRWVFYKKGSVYSFQICQQGKKKSIKANKVLELGYSLQQVSVYPQKNLFIATSNLGAVSAYNVDQLTDGSYSLLIVDKAQPQEFSIQRKGVISQIEGSFEQERRVKIAVSKVLNQTYVAIADNSQYIYFRNYMKRITFQKISLGSVPRSIYLLQSRKDSQVIVGLKEGGIMTINSIDSQQRSRYEGIVNDTIDSLFLVKGKNWLVAQHPNAMSFYSMQ